MSEIYEEYYSTSPKEFLLVLEKKQKWGVESAQKALKKLYSISPCDMSAEKLQSVYDQMLRQSDPARKPKEDHLSRKTKTTLGFYDTLRDIQTRRAG